MNKSVTSREELLAASKEIAYTQGLGKVSIRAVAAACGVAVGSIYNYFPTKADLVAAIIEDFWRAAAHRETCVVEEGEPFPRYVGRLYAQLHRDLSAFQSGWLSQLSALSPQERQRGRALEAKCFSHIRAGMVAAMAQDGRTAELGPEQAQLADLTFRQIMALLREGADHCAYLQQVLEGYLRSLR